MPSSRSSNQPTDPFGGPPNRRNTTSLVVAIVAVALFAVLRLNNGGIGNLFGSATEPAPTASSAQPTTQATAEQAASDNTPTVKATATAHPTRTPKDNTSAKPTTTPHPTQTPKPTGVNQARPTKTPRPTATLTPTANAPPATQASDLPVITLTDLPPEAQHTISLIDQGGPFPYSRDGIVFENRERILPRKSTGYYHEYTVVTPGSSDRGARRIITGQGGEMYYTDDHYETFHEIVR